MLGAEGAVPSHAAVRFTGPEAIRMPAGHDFSQAPDKVVFSIELWIKPDSIDGYRFLLDHEEHESVRGGWLVAIEDGDVSFELWADGSSVAVAQSSNKPVTVGQWHHLVCAYDASHPFIWVDGKVVYSNTAFASVPLPAIQEWSIGKQNCTPCTGSNFEGSVDELAIYDRMLNQAIIDDHYAKSGR
jgi:hypothetical protein